MLPSSARTILTDPVCGRQVEITSPYRVIHGGALFAFCSAACSARFAELPSRYAVIMSALSVRGSDTRPSAPMPLGATDAAGSAAAVASKPATQPALRSPPSMASAAAAPLDRQAASAAPGAFSWLHTWRERRFAAACARQMLALHRKLSTSYPELKGPSLYRRVVAARVGDDLAAEAVLQHAQQSFAIWPVERALTFRDVVHYLAVSEFTAKHVGARWVVADMKHIVDAMIPQHL